MSELSSFAEDQELLAAVRKGESVSRGTWEAIFLKYREIVFHVIAKLLGDRVDPGMQGGNGLVQSLLRQAQGGPPAGRDPPENCGPAERDGIPGAPGRGRLGIRPLRATLAVERVALFLSL